MLEIENTTDHATQRYISLYNYVENYIIFKSFQIIIIKNNLKVIGILRNGTEQVCINFKTELVVYL